MTEDIPRASTWLMQPVPQSGAVVHFVRKLSELAGSSSSSPLLLPPLSRHPWSIFRVISYCHLPRRTRNALEVVKGASLEEDRVRDQGLCRHPVQPRVGARLRLLLWRLEPVPLVCKPGVTALGPGRCVKCDFSKGGANGIIGIVIRHVGNLGLRIYLFFFPRAF